MYRILILEDDLDLCRGITLSLEGENELVPCHSLAQARMALNERTLDLAILDVNLPDGSGLDLLKEIRKSGGTPVILLTANDMETDIVAGLELGADDYITKPFSLAVLRARVNAQLRRGAGKIDGALKTGDFCFDFERMEFSRGGQAIELSKTEQRLLRCLTENRGRTLTREMLLDRVWPDGTEYVDENALSVSIKRLRDKLEETPSKPQYIKTVYGVGYTWVVK